MSYVCLYAWLVSWDFLFIWLLRFWSGLVWSGLVWFEERVSHTLGWPGARYVVKDDLNFRLSFFQLLSAEIAGIPHNTQFMKG